MATTSELGLSKLTVGGTTIVAPFNALADSHDMAAGLQASDRRQNQVLTGIELAAGAGLTLNINVVGAGTAIIWQRGERNIVSAGTTLTPTDNATNYVFYNPDAAGNKFYAQQTSIPAGTADVFVGLAITAGSSITAAYTNLFCNQNWGYLQNNSGQLADFGHVVVADLNDSNGYVMASTSGLARAIGVAAGQTVNGNFGPVVYGGRWFMRVTGTVAVGDVLGCGPLLGVGTTLTSPASGAVLAKALAARSGAGTSIIPIMLV